jgi:hypothetical protein
MNASEKNELLLAQLIFMFQTAALQQMGKLKNPVTEKIERDLQQAQMSIDILAMLHGKMKGNLAPGEEKMFSGVLQELRLNYVDEAAKPAPPASGGGTAATP